MQTTYYTINVSICPKMLKVNIYTDVSKIELILAQVSLSKTSV